MLYRTKHRDCQNLPRTNSLIKPGLIRQVDHELGLCVDKRPEHAGEEIFPADDDAEACLWKLKYSRNSPSNVFAARLRDEPAGPGEVFAEGKILGKGNQPHFVIRCGNFPGGV